MSAVFAVLLGAVLIPMVAWRVVGKRRQQDPLLLPICIVASALAVGGIADSLTGGAPDWKLVLSVPALAWCAHRWRLAGQPTRTS
jgi:hypothetical protein